MDASRGYIKLFRAGHYDLGVYNTALSLNTSYHLKVIACGANIKVYWSGYQNGMQPCITATDATPITSGQFGLNVYNSTCIFNNVKITDEVSVKTLLEEMVDRDKIAQFPNYKQKSYTSYDRNQGCDDYARYIRTETNGGRTEYVMMEDVGPGVLTHIWKTVAEGTLRVYLNGSSTPVIE